MPEQADTDMPQIVQERMGRAEQDINTLQWRVTKLEEWPPHIMQAQRDIEAIVANMSNLQRSVQETRDDMRHGFDAISDKMDAGFLETREVLAVNRGRKSGLSRGFQIAISVLTIGAAGAGGAIWYADRPASVDVIGVTAQCEDGTYSTSEGRGTCSGHGGVNRWLPGD